VITDSYVCVGCLKPAGASQKIGEPCPHDCKHCQIVRRIEQGRFSVEIRADGNTTTGGTEYRADGFITSGLSREFSDRHFVSLGAAEHQSYKWLAKKNESQD